MSAQLDLEVRCKRLKKGEDHLIYIYIGVKKFREKKTQRKKKKKKKTLMVKCYKLVDPME
jgi:hypothetical protein